MQHIQSLEQRQLLSASVHAAAKTKPVIPDVLGVFAGTGTETKPAHNTGSIELNVNNESAKGIITGTAVNLTEDRTGNFTGKVTAKGAFSFKVLNTLGKTSSTFTGKYNSGEITGKYKIAGTKSAKPSSGTFSISRATT